MPTSKAKKRTKAYHPEESFYDRESVGLALLECLEGNDPESFIEILDMYLEVNRTQVAKEANLARSTVQLAFSKKGNPTLKTMAKIVHQAVA